VVRRFLFIILLLVSGSNTLAYGEVMGGNLATECTQVMQDMDDCSQMDASVDCVKCATPCVDFSYMLRSAEQQESITQAYLVISEVHHVIHGIQYLIYHPPISSS